MFLSRGYSCAGSHYPAGGGQFLPWSTISLGPEIPKDVSSTPRYCCTERHLPAGGDQLPLGLTISSGQFCWPQASAPGPLLRYSRRFPCDLFRRDHLTFGSGFPFLGTLLFALQACHCGPFLRDLLPLRDVLAPALDLPISLEPNGVDYGLYLPFHPFLGCLPIGLRLRSVGQHSF
jgi:hypothetical protein